MRTLCLSRGGGDVGKRAIKGRGPPVDRGVLKTRGQLKAGVPLYIGDY